MKPQRLDRGLITSGKTIRALGNVVNPAYIAINCFNIPYISVQSSVLHPNTH